MTGHRECEHADKGLAADMALLDELLDTVARRERPLSEEDLDTLLGVTARQRSDG